MRKQKDDMQVNVAGLRRNIKNLAHNYSDAQVKVREATSNDPWGPSATIMAEIADLTYNVVAFSEIMQMIWKRLNDHGKNWRHVYKALILLEYLIKTGTEKVAQQCKENIFAIQTLREFVYFEEGKDQGTHVREKAKQLVNLLKDDERLKNERVKALKAKERFAQHPSGFGSDGYIDGPSQRDMPPGWQEEPKSVSELEMVRPQTAGEEELQLQLAMAMSREEAEQEEAKRRSDDVRLQLALSQSEQDFKDQTVRPPQRKPEEQQSHLVDLLDISLGATSISSPPLGAAGGAAVVDPWAAPNGRAASQLSDPWSGTSSPQIADPWHPTAAQRSVLGPPMGMAMGGGMAGMPVPGATNGSEAWALRTQSPSVASGSSNEGWLQTNGNASNGIGMNGGAMVAGGSSAAVTDPWLTKSTATSALAAAPPTLASRHTPADGWLNESGGAAQAASEDPWAPSAVATTAGGLEDPWKSIERSGVKKLSPDMDEFDIITNRNKAGDLINTNNSNASNNNNASLLDEMDPLSINYGHNNSSNNSTGATTKRPLKDPQSFLGENSALVNLDNLIKPIALQTTLQPGGSAAYNPFSDNVMPPKTNLFQQQQPAVPSINQLKQQAPFAVNMNQDPWAPINNTNVTSQQPKQFLIESDVGHQPQSQQQNALRPTSLNLHQINAYNNNNSQKPSEFASSDSHNFTLDKRFFNNNEQQQSQQQQEHQQRTQLAATMPKPMPSALLDNYNTNVDNIRNMDILSETLIVTTPTTATMHMPSNTPQQTYFNSPATPAATPAGYQPLNMSNTNLNCRNSINNNNNKNHVQSFTTYAQCYSNALSASLASTPGITIGPPTCAQDLLGFGEDVGVDTGYGSLQTTPYGSGIGFNYTEQQYKQEQQQQHQQQQSSAMLNLCKLENNNNMPWLKPEAAATNPFLS